MSAFENAASIGELRGRIDEYFPESVTNLIDDSSAYWISLYSFTVKQEPWSLSRSDSKIREMLSIMIAAGYWTDNFAHEYSPYG